MRLFGDLQLRWDGARLVDFSSKKGKALLCYLAVTGQPQSRAALSGLLWPESPEENARASLRRTLTGIRKMAPDCLSTTRQTAAVNADAQISVDVIRFAALVADGAATDDLQEAVALYQGDFLERFYLPDAPPFDRWALGQRARLRQMALEALHSLAVHFAGRREYGPAVSYARQVLDIEPWRESGHRDLMRLLALSGQRSAALKQYETCCQLLADELSVAPAAETTTLYERIRDEALRAGDGPDSLAAENNRHVFPRSPPQPVHNLPAAATPFVGREAELTTLATLIADPQVRIITITGPGGMGKTRLALEAAGREVGRPSQFPDGAFFVSLAPLESAADIVTALAAALSFQFSGSGPESEQLLNYLREKRMLLVMDNLEHIPDGRTLLAEINGRAAGITLLVTSHERLQMRGEQLFPLHGLALAPTVELAPETAAGQLFLHIARRTVPDFRLLEGDTEPLLRLCRLVEGMPLALELAASWVGLLPLSEIVAEIEQSLSVLAAEHSDVPPRHQSMEAALDVSWRRLTPEQQRAFQALTVFQGGFAREAAAAVADAPLPLLVALANKSWLSYHRPQDRYHIHMLLRQYGAGLLHADPAREQEIRQRHSAFFCDYLQERETGWHGPRQLDVAAAVRAEMDNIHRAWHHVATKGDSHLLAQGLDSLCRFYLWEGRMHDGHLACRSAADGLANSPTVERRDDAQFLALWSQVLAWESEFATDVERKEALLAKSQQLLDRATQTGWDTLAHQANLYLFRSHSAIETDLAEAERLAKLALERYRALDDRIGEAEALELVGISHLFQGDLALAGEFLQESLAISRQLGDMQGTAVTMTLLGMADRHRGDFEKAETLMRQAIGLHRQMGNRLREQFALGPLCVVLIQSGKFPAAREAALEANDIARDLGNYPDPFFLDALAKATLHLGHYGDAMAMATESLELARQKGNVLEAGWALECLGELAYVLGDLEQAEGYLQESVNVLSDLRHVYRVLAQAALGYVFRRLGQVELAKQAVSSALGTGVDKHSILPVIMCLPIVALLAAADDRPGRAVELYYLARRFGHVSNSHWYADVACRELDSVYASMPAGAAETAAQCGRELDVWQTAEALLVELAEVG